MQPTDSALPILREFLPSVTVPIAGAADGNSGNRYGLAGFASGAFGSASNDMVVSEESALADLPNGRTVDCDHFSYLLNPMVQGLLHDALVQFSPSPRRREEIRPDSERLIW